MRDALIKPILARIRQGRIEAEALKDIEGAEVIVLSVADQPEPAHLLQPNTPAFAELAGLCGCAPQELEQALHREWDAAAARRQLQKTRRYARKRARQQGLQLATEEDVLAHLARD